MFKALGPEGLILISPPRFEDARGYFQETYVAQRYAEAGITCEFVQDNQSFSKSRGVLRGLHYQAPPHAQAKLVRCSRGAIFDVAVDLRAGSPTYGRHAGVELSADNGDQIFIPEGFAHGFCTLTEDVLIDYKVSHPYTPEAEQGLIWNDPDLGVQWPVEAADALLSDKDRALPAFSTLDTPFDI